MNFYHTYHDWNIFPDESSVGQLFINENEDRSLQSKCLFEFNFDMLEGDVIGDTSGNGNKAILIGDYSIKKRTKETPVSRDSSMDVSELGSKDKAAI